MVIIELKSGKEAAFNLTYAELLEITLEHGGVGFTDEVKNKVATRDALYMHRLMKEIILRSYGIRYGEIFMKSPLSTAMFENTNDLYEVLTIILSDEKISKSFMDCLMSDSRYRIRRKNK